MTTPDNSEGDRARDEVLAGEYVLGVLSLRDRIEIENRIERDRVFAAIVARWQENLSEFDQDYTPVAPPAALFAGLEQRLFSPQVNKDSEGFAGLWNSLALWRVATVASLALLLALALYETAAFGPGDRDEPLVAELSSEDAPVTLLARYDQESGSLQMTPVAAAGPAEERSLELWLVPGGDEPTISLGVLPQTGEGSLVIPADLRQRVTVGATLAVSLEPFGGSPSGQATGPVIAIGQTRRP
ncbi:MAG: anti-sigma factor domain-containing protein [Pseudorhizobium sp.]